MPLCAQDDVRAPSVEAAALIAFTYAIRQDGHDTLCPDSISRLQAASDEPVASYDAEGEM